MGTTVYARREIAYLQDDRHNRSQLFWEVIILRLATTIISTVGYLIFWILNGRDSIVLIQGIYIIAIFFDITWLFQGIENFGAVVLRNIIIKAAGVAFIFLFIKQRSDLYLYIIESAVMPLIGSLILWSGVGKIVSKPDFHNINIKRHLKGSIALFIPTIAAQVYLLLDKTMIGTISVGSAENGYYEQAQKIIRICWTFVTTFGTVMSPRLAYIFANKDRAEVRGQMRRSFRFVWFLSIPITFGLISITDNLVPWFFGDEFLSVKTLLYVFSWIVIPVGLNAITGNQYLVATKRQTWYTISVIVGAASNFVLNLILIPRFLSTGQNQFDFIDYEDFCEQTARAVGQDKITGIINICSGQPEKLADRVERFIKENGYGIKLKYGAFPDRPYDSKAVWGDSRKIEAIMKGGHEDGSDNS